MISHAKMLKLIRLKLQTNGLLFCYNNIEELIMTYHIGQKVTGYVTGIQLYGAFVALDDHTQGLIHISECKSGIVRDLKDELRIGKKVEVVVLDIEQYTQKISLSLRQENMVTNQTRMKSVNLHKRFWTNSHLHYGFTPIKDNQSRWVEEALERISK